MKTVKLGNEEIQIRPQSSAAFLKFRQILKEAGLDRILTGADIIEALKRDSDILHKLAAVLYLNDARSLKRWESLWREWADKYAPLQMLPVIEAGVSAMHEGPAAVMIHRSGYLRGIKGKITS